MTVLAPDSTAFEVKDPMCAPTSMTTAPSRLFSPYKLSLNTIFRSEEPVATIVKRSKGAPYLDEVSGVALERVEILRIRFDGNDRPRSRLHSLRGEGPDVRAHIDDDCTIQIIQPV